MVDLFKHSNNDGVTSKVVGGGGKFEIEDDVRLCLYLMGEI